MALQILITDRSLVPVGDPIVQWHSVEATRRFNEAGTGLLDLTGSKPLRADQLAPGNRVHLIRDGHVWLGGPIIQPGEEDWDAGRDAAGEGQDTIAWTDDLYFIAGRNTAPNPAQPLTAQTVASWQRTGPGGTLIRDLVDGNAGPGALPARRIPHLTIGTIVAGSTVTYTSRWLPLMDEVRSIAIAAGGLGVRVRIVGAGAVFEVFEPRDLRQQIRFSPELDNLLSYRYRPAAPTVNVAIVGGLDEGVDRPIVERVDAASVAAWWRAEEFVNQTADTIAELEQAGDEAIARGGRTAQLTTVTVDTDVQQYGRDYDLGDRVSVQLATGVVVDDIVRAVTLTHTPDDGEQTAPLIGTQDVSTDQQYAALLRDMTSRIGRLETR